MGESGGKHRDVTLQLLGEMFPDGLPPHVGFRLWDGTQAPDAAPRRSTIVLNHPGALRAMLLHGTELALGEAYLHNDFDIEGDAEAVFCLEDALTGATGDSLQRLRTAGRLLQLPQGPQRASLGRPAARLSGKQHSMKRDRAAVTYHYDVSNDFYALWLDQRMVYSCAYFRSPDEELDAAQQNKLDLICRKLRLAPGDRLLDIGCGWGGLAIHAAQQYHADVTAVTLSEPQARLAQERAAAAGVADRCRIMHCDYREVAEHASFDALVSVGMFEHVGRAMLGRYFRETLALLRPGGRFLNHGIACEPLPGPRQGGSFADAYVFPDGELAPISSTLHEAEAAGFEVRDVESLREHYALTLRHWVQRLEARREEALRHVDESAYRTWRLYMSGSAYGFRVGRLNVYQTLLIRRDAAGRSGLPMTREDWYVPPRAA